jgi:Phage tail sheath protein subtilisin-like domain
MSQNVFVSPGVYTSEKDISFITRQIGVTTLGLVGETTIGPAFQPIFINNYGEFQSFFGGLDATKVKDTGAPQYELPYIAKSYLSQANQLFVTRVLGYSGYEAGLAWGIALDAAMNPTTSGATSTATTANPLFTFTATTGTGTVTNLVSPNPLIQALWNQGLLSTTLTALGTQSIGYSGATLAPLMYKTGGNVFTGASFTFMLTTSGTSAGNITGTTTGATISYSGSPYADVDNQVVALLRSRGTINPLNQLPNFEVTGSTQVIFDPAFTDSVQNPLGTFSLSGVSTLQGNFDYNVSLDSTSMNYLPRVLGRGAQDGKTALFLEEFYSKMLGDAIALGKVRGLKQTPIYYSNKFIEYRNQYQAAETPFIVSELRGNKVLRLFRFITISDGNAANEQIKVSIANIKPDTLEFDVLIRGFYDNDAHPTVLESFSRCTMDPTSANFIGRRIGTADGLYNSKSSYVLVELDEESDTSSAYPAGFVGYPIRDYQSNGNTSVIDPTIAYKKAYGEFENKKKVFLGLSDTVGIDSDFFDYKGQPYNLPYNAWTGLTDGYHMDMDASGVTIDDVVLPYGTGGTYNPIFTFQTGDANFNEVAITSDPTNPYAKVFARKFSVAPYGGFDGWDIYRTRRSNTNDFIVNGIHGIAGRTSQAFSYKTLENGDTGINSDYYAYLEAIRTFQNPEAVNINVFATPGIDNVDNSNLIEATIEMIEEERADSLYIMTTPDLNTGGDVMSVDDVVGLIDGNFDSNYSCTYWPWIQINDTENNVLIYVPPTRDVVRNIALTDNIAFPWFAAAGIQRGDVDAIKARKKLTLAERDVLYENRINPIATFTSDGIKIWGNKTLQVKETALNRINVRRLLLQARKLISAVSIRLLFEQNDSIVRNQFLGLVNPILDNIRSERGLTDFRVVLSNSPEDIDRNQLTGQIFLKPTRALEFIQLEFVIMNTGASFNNI